MARKMNAKVVINREAAGRVRLALADGLLAVCEAVVANAHPPDDPKTRHRITGGAVAFLDGRKIGGEASKPSSVRGLKEQGIVAFGGFGFPARFNELGTARQPARPFLWPAVTRTEPQMTGLMAGAARARFGR